MLYFLQTAVSEKKQLEKALMSIYGVGKVKAKNSCNYYGLNKDAKGKNLRRLHRLYLKADFEDIKSELASDLKQSIKIKCLDLIDKKCYRGRRHKNGYPVRGQRTHTNARTQRALYRRWSKNIYEKPKKIVQKKTKK